MAALDIRPDLAARLREVAEREHRSVDDVLDTLLSSYATSDRAEDEIDEDDFDDNINFKPEVADELRQFLQERPRGKSVDDIVRELGLDE